MPSTLSEQAITYLTSIGVVPKLATLTQLSIATAYSTCYHWYINNQKVLPENAALASKIWVQKYCLVDENGLCLEKTPEDMWDRIATVLADVEVSTNLINKDFSYWKGIFYEALKNFKAVPGGSALSVLGNTYMNSSASNCFVVGTEDSLEGIMKTAAEMARLQSYRGGTGIDLSVLRPAGSFVHNSAKYSTGAVSFMDFFSKVTATIGQTGRCLREDQKVLTRRGLIEIKEVIPGESVWTSKGWIENLNTIYNGKKEVYRLTTKRGLSIVATKEHLFTTVSNGQVIEKALANFIPGEAIITIPGTVDISIPYVPLKTDITYVAGHGARNTGNKLNTNVMFPPQLTEELAYFLGYSYGDGSVEYDKFNEPCVISLACAHSHPTIQSKLESAIVNTFGYTANVRKGDGAVNKVNINSKLVCSFLHNNGLLKQLHHSLVMPEKLKQSPQSVQASFISGYFDADGYASGSKKGYVIASVCKSMLCEIQKLLFSFGIVSHITVEPPKCLTHKALYSLFITGTSNQRKAVSQLSESVKINNKGFISKKDMVLTPFIPKMLGIKYNKYSFIGDNSQNISANGFLKLKTLGATSLDELLINDTVDTIELVGIDNVYDLQLASHHLFYCEGFNVHNSGATMISIDSHHPDVEAFIEEKQDLDKAWFFNELAANGIDINDWEHTPIAARLKSTSKANVSIKAYDAFMEAVENDTLYELWYEFKDNKYPRISKMVKARDLWDKFVKANVSSAEPGILFWDTILRESVSDCYAGKKEYSVFIDNDKITLEHDIKTVSTNPCSELPLPVGSACTLLSMNLTQYIINPWLSNSVFDWASFEHDVRVATRMLDNIKEYDISRLPLLVNKVDAILCRRIGLGCHGLADCLAALGIKYDLDAKDSGITNRIYKALANTVYDESVNLGQEKGVFPIWDWELEKNNSFINRLDSRVVDRIKTLGRRNIACLTNAPTGSLSILSRNCSSGIEPVFKLKYLRNVKKQGSEGTTQYTIYHQAAQDCLSVGGDISVFVEANNVPWESRIKLQSIIQQSIDHSISSTLNLPAGTTDKTVSDIYLAAWKSGLKGATVYVEGSRSGVLVSPDIKKKVPTNIFPIERPKTTNVSIHKTRYKDKSYMILVGKVNGVPCEVFGGEEGHVSLPTAYKSATLTKKSRGHYSLTVQLSEDEDDVLKISNIGNLFPAGDIITICRMISLSLRNGVSIPDLVEQLQKSSSALYDSPAVFARVLKQYIPDDVAIAKELEKGKKCPDCGELLTFKRESGCLTEICPNCSFSLSKCG